MRKAVAERLKACSFAFDHLLEMTAFEEFGVMPELGAAVDEMGWTLPTDVQVLLNGSIEKQAKHGMCNLQMEGESSVPRTELILSCMQ